MGNRFSLDIPDVFYQPARPIDALTNSFDKAQAVREERRRWELEQKRQAAKDEQFARQNSIAEQRLGMQDQREQQRFSLDLADRSGKQVGDVAALAAQGRMGEAEAKAAASQYTDPKTGQMRSIQFDRGGERFDPGFENLRLDEPGKDGPRDYSGLQEALPIWGKGEAPAGGLKLQGDFASAMPIGKAPPEGFGKKTVNPSITTPTGQRVEFDPQEGAGFKARQAEEQKTKLMGLLSDPTIPPDTKRAIAIQAGLTGAQATGAERAAVTNSNGQEDAQAFTAGQADKFQQTAADKNRNEAARAAARAKRAVATGGAAKDKNDDLDVLNKKGEVIGSGRTPQETAALRQQRTVLAATDKTAQELKSHLAAHGNINASSAVGDGISGLLSGKNPVDAFQGRMGQQAVRDQLIDRLVAARKEITGAMNEGDVARYKKQFDTAFARGPEAAQEAVDSFTRELDNLYEEKTRSTLSKPAVAPATATTMAPTPATPSPGKKKFVMVNGQLMVEE